LKGGHNIQTDVIERRYLSGIKNLFDIYIPVLDNVLIFDNSECVHELIAKKFKNSDMFIIDNVKFDKITTYGGKRRK
jgi:predicted ABC-type ATPase